jgi:hypothetical protein
MPNVFSLFGELKLDSKAFEGALLRSEAQLKGTQAELTKTEASTGKLGGAMSALASPAGLAAAAVAAIGVAAVVTGKQLFDMASDAAEFGSKIHDAAVQTGLSAEAISALNIAAGQSGSSLNEITNAVSKFNVVLGQAEAGNDKASAALAKYGITATDSTQALGQAFTAISNLSTAQEKAAATAALFKDRTGAILPVIESFDGDLPGLIAKLNEMGLLMSDKSAQAADEFGDALDTLSAQARQASADFALEFAPEITEAMQKITDFLSENKDAWKEWGEGVGQAIQGLEVLTDLLPDVGNKIAGLEIALKGAIVGTGGLGLALLTVYETLQSIGMWFGTVKGQLGGKVSFGGRGLLDDEDGGGTSKSVSDKLYNEIWRDDVRKRADAIKQGWQAEKDVAQQRKKLVDDSIRQAREYAEAVKKAEREAAQARKDALAGYAQGIQSRISAVNLRSEAAGFLGEAKSSLQDQIATQLRAISGNMSPYQADWLGKDGSPIRPAAGAFDLEKQRMRDQAIIDLTRGIDPSQLSQDQRDLAASARNREAGRLEKDATAQQDLIKNLSEAIKSGAIIHIVNDAPNNAKVTTGGTAASVQNRYK